MANRAERRQTHRMRDRERNNEIEADMQKDRKGQRCRVREIGR